MGRRAMFLSGENSKDLEDHSTTSDKIVREQIRPKDSENSFPLAKAIAKWILISITVMMAVGYLVEALDSKARFGLGRIVGRH